jgi:hypothetical protein
MKLEPQPDQFNPTFETIGGVQMRLTEICHDRGTRAWTNGYKGQAGREGGLYTLQTQLKFYNLRSAQVCPKSVYAGSIPLGREGER